MPADWQRKLGHRAQAIFTQVVVIANEPTHHFAQVSLLAGLDQVLHKVMVRESFIAEPVSICGHRNHTRFGTVNKVGHHAGAAI
jgi:hypothetical protein